MFRASNGKTSSGAAFWLIAAIRKKERKGPGIVACSEKAGVTESEDCSCSGVFVGEPEAVSWAWALLHSAPNAHKKTVRRNAGRQRRDSMAKTLHRQLRMINF